VEQSGGVLNFFKEDLRQLHLIFLKFQWQLQLKNKRNLPWSQTVFL